MSALTIRMSERYFVPMAGRLPLAATRGPMAAARIGVLPQHKVPAIRARYLSSGARSSTERRSRFVPTLAAASAAGFSIYYYQRRRNPTRLDHKPEPACRSCEDDKAGVNEPHIMLSAADPRIKAFESVGDEDLAANLPRELAVLTKAPQVPPCITRDHPALVEVPLVTTTKLSQLTSQYKYEQWTFNGTVPGPFIRARVGDVVELTLTNKDETGNPHNIDCHAFTGPGGGAAITTAEENETKTARFRLLNPGLFVYHCAAAPVPVHIANGMYGLMYVQPEEGDLPKVDKEYYVMQSEWYHEPPEVDDDGRPSNTVEFSYPNGLREEPQVVTFNGHESALTRDHPLKASVGDRVRVFFGNAGPNLTSSFHIIGSCFDKAYRDGDVLSPPGRAVQSLSVPSGGSSIVDMNMVVPGTYTIVDHAIFRLDKGAVGFLNVSGEQNKEIYASSEPPRPCVGCKLHS